MLRTVYAYTTITLYLIFGGSLLILLAYIDSSGKAAYGVASSWARFAVRACGIRIDADLTQLDPAQPYIFISNHQSQVDIPILISLLAHYRVRFLAKHTLFRIPVLNKVMLSLGCIPIDRNNTRKAFRTLNKAISGVPHPGSVIVFPEGTRNPTLGKFKAGAIIMAIKTGLPIAPLVIAGSGKIHSKNNLYITPGPVRVTALPPLQIQGNYSLKNRDQLKQDLWSLMNNKLLESE